MNREDLLDSFTKIDNELIERSEKQGKYSEVADRLPFRTIFLKRVLPIAACFVIVFSSVFVIRNYYGITPAGVIDTTAKNTDNTDLQTADFMAFNVSSPDIPQQIQFTTDYNSAQSDEFYEQQRARRMDNSVDSSALTPFLNRTMQAFMSKQDGKNKVYSPVNVYIALSMLASCTNGETQQQILDVLGAKSETDAKETAVKMLKGNYIDNGAIKSLLLNSVWTGNESELNNQFFQKFSQDYYAPVFSGDPTDTAYSAALQKWLNGTTGNLLENSAKEISFDEQMVLTLVSAIYYAANWQNEFLGNNNTEGIFNSTDGQQICTYMNSTMLGNVYTGNGFRAVLKELSAGGNMYFILPDEGISPERIIGSEGLTDLLASGTAGNTEFAEIEFSTPKFDISSDIQLIDYLETLGITDVFNAEKADFSPVSGDNLYVTKIQHSARVTIDEKGVTAAAFTVEMLGGATMPEKTISFTLDKPFIFAITGDTGDILFTGIVNTL